MSWTQELYQIYENNCGKQSGENVLLPVSHSTTKAQIEITVDEDGCLINAQRIENKEDSVTIIPVTTKSKTGKNPPPHPLEEKLIYLAKDYGVYIEGKKSNNIEHFQAYIKGLKNWKESNYSHPAVEAIYKYLVKGTLMKDLVDRRVLIIDEETGKLKENEKIIGIAQEDSFVRFRILYKDNPAKENCAWKDISLFESYTRYSAYAMEKNQLCYATGRMLPCTYNHPIQICKANAKAKLISSNDESGFTYRGRFASKEEAISVSYDFSQKIVNFL